MEDRFGVALAMSEWFAARHEPKKSAEPDTIYVIGDELPTVKIGISCNPKHRLSQLKCQSGRPGLGFLFLNDCGALARRVEADIHEQLKTARVLGEWFNIDHEVAVRTTIKTIRRIVRQAKNERKEKNDRQRAEREQSAPDQTAA